MEEYILDAQKYFTKEAWKIMSNKTQFKYTKLCYIYQECLELGINVELPNFMEVKKNNASQTYSCKFCQTKFILEKLKDKHIKLCKKRNSVVHKKKQNELKKKKYACSECSFVTAHSHSLIRHQKRHMMGREVAEKKVHKCVQCPFTATNKKILKAHWRQHSAGKPHTCIECGKGFLRPDLLKRHSYIHSPARIIYNCGSCEKTYLDKSNLIRHINTIHANNDENLIIE